MEDVAEAVVGSVIDFFPQKQKMILTSIWAKTKVKMDQLQDIPDAKIQEAVDQVFTD